MSPADPLAQARQLIAMGVPVFVLQPHIAEDGNWVPDGGHDGTGYWFPSKWQMTRADPHNLESWRPGHALGMVTGVIFDVVDQDPHKENFDPDWELLNLPKSFARIATPSGGSHDYITPLGVASLDSLAPGVDVKAGDRGKGHGFVFLPPTRKLSKTTGLVGQYEWVIDDLHRHGTKDVSGIPLRAKIESRRARSKPVGYTGPEYKDLTLQQQEDSDFSDSEMISRWKRILAEVATLPEHARDERGYGWELATFKASWAFAIRAASGWSKITEETAGDIYLSLLPEPLREYGAAKWYDGLAEKASDHVESPPWIDLLDATNMLRHLKQAARSAQVSPLGLLAATLARILLEIPPNVGIPGAVKADLNLGVSVVGGTAVGKSVLVELSRRMLGLQGLYHEEVEKNASSGEGIVEYYLRDEMEMRDGKMVRSGRKVLIDDPRLFLIVDEVASLNAQSKKGGSTLLSILRSALSGMSLGQLNATSELRRHVPAHVYRLLLFICVQPSASDVLLNEAEAQLGTPQRMLWASAYDPGATEDVPEWPGPLTWTMPDLLPDLEYPAHVKDELRQHRTRVLLKDPTVDPLTGHKMVTQLKVAAALAVLHCEVKISDQWWSLAGWLMKESEKVQRECRAGMSEAAAKSVVQRAQAVGVAQAHAREAEADALEEKRETIRAKAQAKVKEAGGELALGGRKGFKAMLNGYQKILFEEMLEKNDLGEELRVEGSSLLGGSA